jgi:alpha-L-rhamnosidase
VYQVYGEKLDGMREPSGITAAAPTFSWRLRCEDRGLRQAAYRIVVANHAGQTVWDSGLVPSAQVHGIPYGGGALCPNTDYVWTVASRSNSGDQAVGTQQTFSTGITDTSLWKATWIEATLARKPLTDCTDSLKVMRGLVPGRDPQDVLNPCLYFRRAVELGDKQVKRAIAYATAHGVYELHINGEVYGMPLVPGYTVYAKHQECQRYDVTASLAPGENVFAAIVADGWYTGKVGLMGIGEQYGTTNAFFLQVFLDYADGTSRLVCSDEHFRWSTGGYRYADLFVGERFDAGLEPQGFTLPGYDATGWQPVVCRGYGYGQLTGPMSDPVRVLREQRPKALLKTPAGEIVLDAGENVAGYLRATLRGTKGDAVTLEYSETLDECGNFLQNVRVPGQNKDQKDCYVFGADGEAEYCPRFTYHGFQYVRIEGATDPKLSDFTVVVIGSDLERTGSFICSDDRLNRLQENIFRSQQGNMLYVPTDCPQREKAGWTGDMQIYAPTACFNMDVEAFLRKWLGDMRLEQLPGGQVPHVIPDIPSNAYVSGADHTSSAGWGDACVIVPYRLYETYGDARVLAENYDMMLRWMAHVEHEASTAFPDGYEAMSPERKEWQKHLWNTGFHFGDWLIPSLSGSNSSPMTGAAMTKELTATAMFAYSAGLMAEIARILGDGERAAHFRELKGKIKNAFAREYVKDDGSLAAEFQGMYVLALQMDLLPETKRQAAVGRLVRMIEDNGGRLDTGFLSVPFLLDVLYDSGRPDVAFELLFQTRRPSWLYEVSWGATTVWESWNNITEDGKRHCHSYNHFAFGCVGDFIYRHVLGLQREAPGYERLRVQPDFSCGLEWASGSLETVYGKIAVEWRKEGADVFVRAEIPPNVTADIASGAHETTRAGSGTHEFRFCIM